jgi:hypothetical protein
MPGRLGIGLNVAVQVFLTLVLFGGVNYLSFQYYKRWDLTEAGSHSLSTVTLNYLRKLSKDVEVTLVFPRGDGFDVDAKRHFGEDKQAAEIRVGGGVAGAGSVEGGCSGGGISGRGCGDIEFDWVAGRGAEAVVHGGGKGLAFSGGA